MTDREQTPPHGSSAVGSQPTGPVAPDQRYGGSGVSSGAHGPVGGAENYYTAPKYTTSPIPVRRSDAFAGLLLVLAGVAAAVSLLIDWVKGNSDSGLDLLKAGFDTFSDGIGTVFSSGFWQPIAIILGGGVLFILGLLVLVPAKSHRFLGLLALLVSLCVTAGVLVPLARAGWDFGAFDLGFWFAIAVAVLGLLGSLKALLSGPKYATQPALT
jgi:hypothetical protein